MAKTDTRSDEEILREVADNLSSLGVYNVRCPDLARFSGAIRRVLLRLREAEDSLNGIPRFERLV